MTFSSGSDAVTNFCCSSVGVTNGCHERAIVDAVCPEDVPLAYFAEQERVKRMKKKKKVVAPYKMSREGRTNPNIKSNIDEGGWIFREETLKQMPWANVLATGPEDPLHNRQKICCMICRVNAPMRARGAHEIERHCQSTNQLRQD